MPFGHRQGAACTAHPALSHPETHPVRGTAKPSGSPGPRVRRVSLLVSRRDSTAVAVQVQPARRAAVRALPRSDGPVPALQAYHALIAQQPL